ncbi:hypothetical protein HNR59_001720 [Aquamicrobium lusatiense]|uniref:DUF454 domain-containing protein n=1 Tax=Aquamicrobium lusatiense TaxID=89772 RepID=A0A7W9VVM8_9HYPH|nr:YbaN family protein [Aquamicrobium lusatiense]MBB6012375.1 hypothetical protein [Aquamicrobium lusatiense]
MMGLADDNRRLAGRRFASELRRSWFFAAGVVMLALGVIGAFLPVMPTTIFLILAAWCFGRSSPRLEARLLDHPRFGPVIRDWREYGTIPRRAKCMACSGMALGYGLFWIGARPSFSLAMLVAAPMLLCAAWMVMRPEGGRRP